MKKVSGKISGHFYEANKCHEKKRGVLIEALTSPPKKQATH